MERKEEDIAGRKEEEVKGPCRRSVNVSMQTHSINLAK